MAQPRGVKEYTEQEREIAEREYEEEIAGDPYLRKKKQEHEEKLRIQENAHREEYLKLMTGLTPKEIRKREDEGSCLCYLTTKNTRPSFS